MTSTPYMVALFKLVGDHLRAHPEHYNQELPDTPSLGSCGTPGCLVGWIAYFHRRHQHRSTMCHAFAVVTLLLATELNLDRAAAVKLVDDVFLLDRWPPEFMTRFYAVPPAERHLVAIERLAHFTRTLT